MLPVSRVLFVFVDGVGLGPAGPDNPLGGAWPALETLAGGHAWTNAARAVDEPEHVFRPLDATLGVEGLPQSGTGQATLFTGVNGAARAGRHYGPFPHSKTKPALAEENIFAQIQRLGLPGSDGSGGSSGREPSAFANAYPPRFFDYAQKRDRWTVTTRCCVEAGVPIRSVEALQRGAALAADLTGTAWKEKLGLDVAPISEADAAQNLLRLSQRHAFTLFEYFLTDKAGHSRDLDRARRVLRSLDAFLGALLESRPDDTLLVLTSDHGNLEDLSAKGHTRAPVPLVALGPGARHFRAARDLTDVVPAILNALRESLPAERQDEAASPDSDTA